MATNFKSEEEVKEYIKNIGIEYRFGCFKENKPQACHLLGDYLETIDKNYDKAWKVYKNNCDDGNYGKSCLKCGNYLVMGRGGVKEDKLKATEYYEKSCNLGEMTGCFRAGILSTILSSSPSPLRSFKQAVDLFDKACKGDNHEACYHLSGIFMEGYKEGNIAKDMKRCFDYSVLACNLDNMYACANLSLMYKKGDGVEKNLELSQKYRKKAEELQDEVTKKRQLEFQEGLSRI